MNPALRSSWPALALAIMLGTSGARLEIRAETMTTNVIDGVAQDAGGTFVLGDTGPLNFLLITNGGSLLCTTGIVGRALSASQNSALITGSNSAWLNTGTFVVGATGPLNQVYVGDGARLRADQLGILGQEPWSYGNLLTVSDPGTVLDVPALTIGLGGVDNRLVVQNGARVGRGISGDVTIHIGDRVGSTSNEIDVSGAGTTWFTDGIRVGREGSFNRMILRDGARLTNGFLMIGREISSMANLARIDGRGTVWSVRQGSTWVGFNGSSNLLVVAGGARFETANLTLAASNAATLNAARVDGPGTICRATGTLGIGDVGSHNFFDIAGGAFVAAETTYVGNGGADNRLSVSSGASVLNTGSLWIGSGPAASRNTLTLEGPGTVWTNGSRITLGGSGSENSLSITGGARLQQPVPGSTGFGIGALAGSRANELHIAGAGSAVRGRWVLSVGSSGPENRLTMEDGAFLETSSASIGRDCIAHDNVAWIAGPGTVWSNATLLEIGFCSTNNQLLIRDGARVFAGHVRSSVQGGASNAIVVADSGSLLSANADLFVGNSGRHASLHLSNGARIAGRNDRVGFSGSSAIASVTGQGTIWSNVGLTVGDTDSALNNRVEVSDGAQILSGAGSVGVNPKAISNVVAVSGLDSRWIVTSNLVIGHSGWDNRLEIQGGARVTDETGILGLNAVSRGSAVSVTGPGSAWLHTSSLVVGSNGHHARLVISEGGRVSTPSATIGADGLLAGLSATCQARIGSNEVVVADPGSALDVNGPLVLGGRSLGNTLTVRNGGVVRAASLLAGATNAVEPGSQCGPIYSANQILIDHGELVVTNETADATLELRFSQLEVTGGTVTADRLIATNQGRISIVGGTFAVRGGTVSGPTPLPVGFAVGNGEHAATLILLGGTLSAQPGFGLSQHATLAGDGEIQSLVKSIAGRIAPGRPGHPGRLTLSGGLVAMDGFDQPAFSIDIQGTEPGISHDQVVLDDAAFVARLEVRLTGGFVPQPADTFTVLRFAAKTQESFLSNIETNGRVLTMDRLGSFACRFVATNVVLSDYQSTDLDGDGLEDAWALRWFGHSPLTATERGADADGDGASNADEFKAGTDPRDAASVLRIRASYYGVFLGEFAPVPGRTYHLWASDDLVTWRELPDSEFEYLSGMPSFWEYPQDSVGGAVRRSRFFRVSVE